MDSPTKSPVSNAAFGHAVGVHFTTASRYRNGERVPSTDVALKIVKAYGLDLEEMIEAMASGREIFGHYIRMRVFGPEPSVDLNEDGTERKIDRVPRHRSCALPR